jgi:hypothetical protein
MTDLSQIIPVKNHLLKNVKIDEVIGQIRKRVEALPNYAQYKNDVEFLLLVCNMLEHLIVKKDKIDKKQLLIEIYKQLFMGITPAELANVEANIEFLWNNKKIKKQSFYKLFCAGVTEWFKKKFL